MTTDDVHPHPSVIPPSLALWAADAMDPAEAHAVLTASSVPQRALARAAVDEVLASSPPRRGRARRIHLPPPGLGVVVRPAMPSVLGAEAPLALRQGERLSLTVPSIDSGDAQPREVIVLGRSLDEPDSGWRWLSPRREARRTPLGALELDDAGSRTLDLILDLEPGVWRIAIALPVAGTPWQVDVADRLAVLAEQVSTGSVPVGSVDVHLEADLLRP